MSFKNAFKGKYGTFRINNRGYYQCSSKKERNMGKLLHRLIWEDHYQTEIPRDYVIHHINNNRLDNRIQNLQCVKRGIHTRYHHLGRKYSSEIRNKMSIAKKGKNNPNFGKFGEDHQNYGRCWSDETKRKISESTKGKKLSEETKRKLSISKQGLYVGENHPRSKITEKDVIQIRKMKKQGFKKKEVFEKIAKPLGLSFKSGFRQIWENRTWKHVRC